MNRLLGRPMPSLIFHEKYPSPPPSHKKKKKIKMSSAAEVISALSVKKNQNSPPACCRQLSCSKGKMYQVLCAEQDQPAKYDQGFFCPPPCSLAVEVLPEGICSFVPLKKIGIFPYSKKIKISIFCVSCSTRIALVPCSFHFKRLFPCSPEINGILPFSKKPWESLAVVFSKWHDLWDPHTHTTGKHLKYQISWARQPSFSQ